MNHLYHTWRILYFLKEHSDQREQVSMGVPEFMKVAWEDAASAISQPYCGTRQADKPFCLVKRTVSLKQSVSLRNYVCPVFLAVLSLSRPSSLSLYLLQSPVSRASCCADLGLYQTQSPLSAPAYAVPFFKITTCLCYIMFAVFA